MFSFSVITSAAAVFDTSKEIRSSHQAHLLNEVNAMQKVTQAQQTDASDDGMNEGK